MDLRSMLNNDEADGERSRRSQSSTASQGRGHPVPRLQTSHGSPPVPSPLGRESSMSQRSMNTPSTHSPTLFRPPLDQRTSSMSYGAAPQGGTPSTPYTPMSSRPPNHGYFGAAVQASPVITPAYHGMAQYNSPSPARQDPMHNLNSPHVVMNTHMASPATHEPPQFERQASSWAPSQHRPPDLSRQTSTASPARSTYSHHPPPPLRQETSHSSTTAVSASSRPPSSHNASLGSFRRESLSVSPKTVPYAIKSSQPSPEHIREAPPRNLQPTTFQQPSPIQPEKMEPQTTPSQAPTSIPQTPTTPLTNQHSDQAVSSPPIARTKRSLGTQSPSVEHQGDVKRRRVDQMPPWAGPAKRVRLLSKFKGQKSKLSMSTTVTVPVAAVAPTAPTPAKPQGPLGYLEKSFNGDIEPHEDLTRRICDWLFLTVVTNDILENRSTSQVQGQLEIEAKIGHIIDKHHAARLQLPILTETILRESHDYAFESVMTLQQHKMFNELLNGALKESIAPKSESTQSQPRVGMEYRHKYEVDTMYPLPEAEALALPISIQRLLKTGAGRIPRVRVTRDQKTGEVLAKVVKARIADIHVYNPGYLFDYRISVNLEAVWDGDLDSLMQSRSGFGTESERYKDRVSYKHQCCQIDLTQVKGDARSPNQAASHELEIELDAEAVKEQGRLVLENKPNQYEQLVKVLLDNARLLVRAGGKIA